MDNIKDVIAELEARSSAIKLEASMYGVTHFDINHGLEERMELNEEIKQLIKLRDRGKKIKQIKNKIK
jgi:hypothetical protein